MTNPLRRRDPRDSGATTHRRGTAPLPAVEDWTLAGGHHQLVVGEPGTGCETPSRLKSAIRILGQDLGAARTREAKALGKDAGPIRFIVGLIGVRKGVLTQTFRRAEIALAQRVRTVGPRKAEAKQKVQVLGQRLMRLTEHGLPAAAATAAERRRAFEQKRDEYRSLPRMVRGYFATHRPVIFVGVAVVLFDVAVLHGIMEYSGASPAQAWATSLTVPLAIGAINHGVGVLGGAIGLRSPARNRMRLAVVVFVAALGSMVVAFLLLTIFRAQAADSQNAAIQALAEGDANAQLTFLLSPIWMGPLQIAGSFTAIAMTAFWVMSKPGREFVADVLIPAKAEWEEAQIELKQVQQHIEATHQELENAALVEHQIEADGEAAQVEVDASREILSAAVATEDALAEAMQGEYVADFTYFDQIGKNGGVWRMAQSTVFPRIGRPYTPGATDTAADDDLIAERHAQATPRQRRFGRRSSRSVPMARNGHRDHQIDPDHLTKL